MKSILEEIINDYVKKLNENNHPSTRPWGADKYERLVYQPEQDTEHGMAPSYYYLCTHPQEFKMALAAGARDVTDERNAWIAFNHQENGMNGMMECYDILDTKTNKKMNSKSYKNKNKALGRVESANIAHGTPRYTLKSIKLQESETPFSAEYKKRAEDEWSRLAGDPVTVDKIGGVLYAYGSELGCYRLHYKIKKGRVNYSKNLETWYYTTE